MRERFYTASDYAGVDSDHLQVYYGYECTDEQGNWCFRAQFNGQEVRYPWQELGVRDQWNCEHNLIAGLAKLFMTHKIGKETP